MSIFHARLWKCNSGPLPAFFLALYFLLDCIAAFSLIEGIDKDVIEAKITKYEEENYEQIINARARKVRHSFIVLIYFLL